MKKRALQFAIIFLIAGFILTLIIGLVERRALRSYKENVPYVALAETIKNRVMQAQLRLAQIETGNSLLTVDNDVLPLLTSSEAILDGAYGGKSNELGNFVKLDDEKRAILKEAVFNLGKVVSVVRDFNSNAALASIPAPVVQAASDSADSLAVEPVTMIVQSNPRSTVNLDAAMPGFVQFTATIDKFNTALQEQVTSDQERLNVYSWLSILGLGVFFTGIGVMVYRLQGTSDKIVAENAAQIEQQHKSAKSLSTFIDSISAGNFSVNIDLEGDDALAGTLLSMRDKLRENAENDRKRNWSTTSHD